MDRDRALDLAGGALAVVVLCSIALAVFGAVQAGSTDSEVPDGAEWSVERVDDSTIEIEHVGNETVYAENLALRVDGKERGSPFEGPTVEPGDATTITVDTNPTVLRVEWTGGSGGADLMYAGRV